MEALAIGLATKAIQIIAPYVKKGFEKFAGDFDDATAKKVKGFFNIIKKRLIGDDFASKTMEKFEEKPESYMESAKDVLKDKIMNDKTFKTELEEQLEELGPIVDIFQDIKVVKGTLIGIDGAMSRFKAKLVQKSDEITEGATVIGWKVAETN